MYKVFIEDKPVILLEDICGCYFAHKSMQVNCTDPLTIRQAILDFAGNKEANILYLFNNDEPASLLLHFNSVFRHIIAGGGLVKSDNGLFLFILRHGKWDLPKGKPDQGETIEQTAMREVKEETGVKKLKISKPIGLTHHAYIHKDDLFLKTTYWFEMTTKFQKKLQPQTKEDITEARWLSMSQIPDILDGAHASIKELVKDYFLSN